MDILGGAVVDNKSNKLSFGSEVIDIFGIQLNEVTSIKNNEKVVYFLSSDSTLTPGLVEKTKKNENILKTLKEEVKAIYEIKLKDAMNKEEKENMLQILNNHELLFSEAFQAGKLKVDKVEFQFKEGKDISTPRVMPLRPLAHSEIEVVNNWIKEALQKNIIEPSASTWRATIFPVKKPDTVDSSGKVKKNWRIVTPLLELNNKKGWKIGQDYLEKIKKLEKPTDKKSLRSFIGVLNWQRRYIPHFSNKIKPLTDLLKEDKKVKED
eukprot:snap_masked-scaffold_3-processed-gene-4.21-mRNA-1 protein AED:1.00 eAED:1.00 QI:0/0/0/0/1/1/2/0/265